MPSPAYLTPPPVTTPCTETDHHYYRHHTAAGARGRKYAVQTQILVMVTVIAVQSYKLQQNESFIRTRGYLTASTAQAAARGPIARRCIRVMRANNANAEKGNILPFIMVMFHSSEQQETNMTS